MRKKKFSLESSVRTIPDFPKPGILFYDITTLLQDKKAFREAIGLLVKRYKGKKISKVVAVEARGFVVGGAVAKDIGAGVVLVRKKGKLPWKTDSVSYSLEYGTDTLEMNRDALEPGERVLIIDDLLATGGTVGAVTELVEKKQGKIIGIAFLIELVDLKGREKLKGYPVHSLITFKGE